MGRTGRTSLGRRRTKLLAALAVVLVAFLIPVDRSAASPGPEPPDLSRCDGLEGEERGACIWTLDRNCSFAQSEDLELCKAHACRGTPSPMGLPVNPADYLCREWVERRGEQLAPGQEFDCAERPPMFDALVSPWWYHPMDQIEEFLEGVGLKKPVAKIVVPARPSGDLGAYHDEWYAELDQHGQCYLKDHYPRACEQSQISAAQHYIRPEQEPGLIPDPCVAEFRSGQYDINYSVGGFVNPEDRLFGSLTNVFFGVGKGALQVAFVAVDYATDFDLVDKLGGPVQSARRAYETEVVGPFDLKDIAWLLLISYVAFLVVAGKFGVAGAELAVSVAMLALFTVVMEGPGGPDAYMRGARDTVDQASVAVLQAGCAGSQSSSLPVGPPTGHPTERRRPDPPTGHPTQRLDPDAGCEREVLRDIQGQLHTLFVHEPYKYINWNWTPQFEEDCGSKMNFILATGPHGTVDWVRDYMRRGRAADGPCSEAATWNADATPERMVQALLAGSIAFAIAIVLLAMSLTVILAKLVIAMLFMLAPFAFALAVLPGQARRLASSWWTTLAQAIVVAIGMCVVLTLLLVGLRSLAQAPTANLSPVERWFIIIALVVMIWYARKRLLATARNVATSVNERLARPGAPGGGFGGGGMGLTDPRSGSIFGATRMSAAEGVGLVMQGITAAGVTSQLALKPIGAAGRTVQAAYGRRAAARLAYKNLLRMDSERRRRDAIDKAREKAMESVAALSGGGGGRGGPSPGRSAGGGGGRPSPPGGPFGGGRSGRPPGGGGRGRSGGPPEGGGRRGGSGRSSGSPSGSGSPTPVRRAGPMRHGDERIREMQDVRSGRGGGFWQRRWSRREDEDAASRPGHRPRGWMVDRTAGWVGDRYGRLRGWAGNRYGRLRDSARRGYDRMDERWERRDGARPLNRHQGWRHTRREDLHDINLRYERMRRDAAARPTLGQRRDGIRDARQWRRRELRAFRDRWEPEGSAHPVRDLRRRFQQGGSDGTGPPGPGSSSSGPSGPGSSGSGPSGPGSSGSGPSGSGSSGRGSSDRGASGSASSGWRSSRTDPWGWRSPESGSSGPGSSGSSGGSSPGPGSSPPEPSPSPSSFGSGGRDASPGPRSSPPGRADLQAPWPDQVRVWPPPAPRFVPSSSSPGSTPISVWERGLAQRASQGFAPESEWTPGGKGVSVAHKVRLADGTNGVYKPISGETQASWDAIPYRGFASREVAASRLNEDLRFGLVPATAFWDGREGRGSLQAFAANARAADGRLQSYPREQRERMAVFDYITGNGDRNNANYLVGQNGRLIAIDHGWTFPESTHFIIRSDFVAEFYRQPLSDRTRELLASVNLGHVRRRLLAAGLSGQAVGGALNRLAELRTHGRITGEAWGGQITDVEWKPVQAGGGR